jgi:hypothetical protein
VRTFFKCAMANYVLKYFEWVCKWSLNYYVIRKKGSASAVSLNTFMIPCILTRNNLRAERARAHTHTHTYSTRVHARARIQTRSHTHSRWVFIKHPSDPTQHLKGYSRRCEWCFLVFRTVDSKRVPWRNSFRKVLKFFMNIHEIAWKISFFF